MISSHFFTVEGIVIKRRSVGESDRVITVFTKERGKIRVLAKGIRRVISRRAPHLELFNRVKLYLTKGKTWDIVTDVKAWTKMNVKTMGYQKISMMYFVAELIDVLLPDRQEHRDVYELLKQTFDSIQMHQQEFTAQSLLSFSATLLGQLGYISPQTPGRQQFFSLREVQVYIERIIEKKLRSPKLFLIP